MVYFCFHSFQCLLFNFFKFLPWPIDYLEECCLLSKCLKIFLLFFCYLKEKLDSSGQGTHFCMISIIFNLLRVFHGLRYGLLWHICYRGTWREAFCCWWWSVLYTSIRFCWLMVLLSSLISLLTFYGCSVKYQERCIQVSKLWICLFLPSVLLTLVSKNNRGMFGWYTFRITMSSWHQDWSICFM